MKVHDGVCKVLSRALAAAGEEGVSWRRPAMTARTRVPSKPRCSRAWLPALPPPQTPTLIKS